jgi:alpha-beta hydrolase superfamily lysophospholipase
MHFGVESALLFLQKKKNPSSILTLLTATLILQACAALPLLRPLPPALPPTDRMIPANFSFTMDDGTVLPARLWLPPPGAPVQGVMLALHGFTDSRDGWEIPAPVFVQSGYAVYAPDQRGFGQTASRGHWAGVARMVRDGDEAAAELRRRYPGVPLVVIGESMGGAVAAVMAAEPRPVADATVLSAPALWGWDQLSPDLAAILWTTDLVAPDWAPDPGRLGADIRASDNIPALYRFGRDPLTLRQPSIAQTRGLVDLMQAAQDVAPRLTGRVLILSGRRDQLVPPQATHAAWARLPETVRKAFYPDGYHLLLRDRDRALVLADIISWLGDPDHVLPSGADIAASAWLADHAWETDVPWWAGDEVPGRREWPR